MKNFFLFIVFILTVLSSCSKPSISGWVDSQQNATPRYLYGGEVKFPSFSVPYFFDNPYSIKQELVSMELSVDASVVGDQDVMYTFEVEDGVPVFVANQLEKVNFVAGKGTLTFKKPISFLNSAELPQSVFYRLRNSATSLHRTVYEISIPKYKEFHTVKESHVGYKATTPKQVYELFVDKLNKIPIDLKLHNSMPVTAFDPNADYKLAYRLLVKDKVFRFERNIKIAADGKITLKSTGQGLTIDASDINGSVVFQSYIIHTGPPTGTVLKNIAVFDTSFEVKND